MIDVEKYFTTNAQCSQKKPNRSMLLQINLDSRIQTIYFDSLVVHLLDLH